MDETNSGENFVNATTEGFQHGSGLGEVAGLAVGPIVE
jgi:hypothetical protein